MQHAPEEEASAEVDEPPDDISFSKQAMKEFKRNAVQKQKEKSESLLTKALNHPEEEAPAYFRFNTTSSRRRSVNSNISLASTIDLTPDTGLTSPARTSTPSPPPPMFSLPRLNAAIVAKPDPRPVGGVHGDAPHLQWSAGKAITDKLSVKVPAGEGLAKKRCISFACGAKPDTKKPNVPSKSPEAKPVVKPATEEPKPERRTCIKFACPSKPSAPAPASDSKETTPTVHRTAGSTKEKGDTPTASRLYRSPSMSRRARRSSTPRPTGHVSESLQSKKYLTANHGDMNSESSRFHEFASDEPEEEDWIRLNLQVPGQRLTINDTLRKENEIRRLGKEAEDEALAEFEQDEQGYMEDDENEDEDEADAPDDEDEDEVDEDDGDDGSNADDDQLAYDSVGDESCEDGSDGYKTDNEIGFAESDDDDGDNLELWTLSQGRLSEGTPIYRRPSLASNHSDSSTSSEMAKPNVRRSRGRSQRIKIRPGTPELPDSTDFVCGTLDEDRVLEDAYISCIAARRREKLHLIPQDIDPSFPTSEPEDEDDVEPHKPANNSDDHVWIHGELEDLHHEKARAGERQRKKSDHASPKRYRSPPPKPKPKPKRIHSPAPKARARSPRRPVDRHSPRRTASPAPRRFLKFPTAPIERLDNPGRPVFGPFPLGPVVQTKSLPRASAVFPQHLKASRKGKTSTTSQGIHVRGAIDIVKGLEQKRQRRKEKFKEKYFHKHCNRARKGQTVEKKTQPGQGAERMREVGLFMAGKQRPGQFVLSV